MDYFTVTNEEKDRVNERGTRKRVSSSIDAGRLDGHVARLVSVDRPRFAQAAHRHQRRPRRAVEIAPRNRPRAARAARLEERLHLAIVPLVAAAARPRPAIAGPQLDSIPFLPDGRPAAAEHLEAVDRARLVAAGLA